jgi:hypothetical protein
LSADESSKAFFKEEYVDRYLESNVRRNLEERSEKLGPRHRIVDETYIPMYPRFLWLTARFNYVYAKDVGCILLCSAALEAGLKEILDEYFTQKLKLDFGQALDEMEIRTLIAACETLKLVDQETVKMIRAMGDIRHQFVHSKIHRIAEKIEQQMLGGDEQLKKEWKSFNSTVRDIWIAGKAGEDKSLEILETLERIFKSIFQVPRQRGSVLEP